MAKHCRSTCTDEIPTAPTVRNGPPRLISVLSTSGRWEQKIDSRCPKCLRAVPSGRESCPKCGLIFSLWKNGMVHIPGISSKRAVEDPGLLALWQQIENDPENEACHEAFLKYCREGACLDVAALKYQVLLLQNPESSLAKAFRERIIFLAQCNCPSKPRPSNGPSRFTGVKIILSLGLIFLFLTFVMTQTLIGY